MPATQQGHISSCLVPLLESNLKSEIAVLTKVNVVGDGHINCKKKETYKLLVM